ncbi:DUF1877 family protein [Nocardia sp. IBHARD005]|uniref:DUF1877 family protein n=1 Tax=Nocardia sp. IBHARD005 TaxID=3457765 RepID=UPI00405927A2
MGVSMSFQLVSEDDLARARVDAEWGQTGIFEVVQPEGKPSGSLDKVWHGLSYLFEMAGSGVDLVYSAEQLDADGHSFGWNADLVRRTAEQLRIVTFDQLDAQYDPARMDEAGIYPRCWASNPDDWRKDLEHHFDGMVTLFEYAADRKSCLVQYLG